jgi:hypothetical protein
VEKEADKKGKNRESCRTKSVFWWINPPKTGHLCG